MCQKKKKLTLADMRKTKLGPVGYFAMISAWALGYAIFIRPYKKKQEQIRFEEEAKFLAQLQQSKSDT